MSLEQIVCWYDMWIFVVICMFENGISCHHPMEARAARRSLLIWMGAEALRFADLRDGEQPLRFIDMVMVSVFLCRYSRKIHNTGFWPTQKNGCTVVPFFQNATCQSYRVHIELLCRCIGCCGPICWNSKASPCDPLFGWPETQRSPSCQFRSLANGFWSLTSLGLGQHWTYVANLSLCFSCVVMTNLTIFGWVPKHFQHPVYHCYSSIMMPSSVASSTHQLMSTFKASWIFFGAHLNLLREIWRSCPKEKSKKGVATATNRDHAIEIEILRVIMTATEFLSGELKTSAMLMEVIMELC